MGLLRTAALALAMVCVPAVSAAETFKGQLDIYTIEAPSGWGWRQDSNSDMNFDAPGGNHNGGMFIGLKDANITIEADIDRFIGQDPVIDRRTVYIDGQPCRTAQTRKVVSVVIINTLVICHIVVPFSEGDYNLSFFFGMASKEGDIGWHSDLFWQAANTIRWGEAFATAP